MKICGMPPVIFGWLTLLITEMTLWFVPGGGFIAFLLRWAIVSICTVIAFAEYD